MDDTTLGTGVGPGSGCLVPGGSIIFDTFVHYMSVALIHTHTIIGSILSEAVVLSLWAVTPIEVIYEIPCISDVCITVHHSSKVTVMK